MKDSNVDDTIQQFRNAVGGIFRTAERFLYAIGEDLGA